MLEQEGAYNDLSPKLREVLEERINSFGKRVRYKFNLARKNLDPQKYNGEVIYPAMYNLDPIQFKITDNYEDRKGVQKLKNVGLLESAQKDDKGNYDYRFTRIRLVDKDQGIKDYEIIDKQGIVNEEIKSFIAYLELHPKLNGGLFQNMQLVPMFSRIDETKDARKEREERSARKKAMDAVEEMSDAEICEFADAMMWDSTDDIELIKNKVEALAEKEPKMFNEKIESKQFKLQATVKKAIDTHLLDYNPADGSLAWNATGQKVLALGQNISDKTDIERFGEWFATAGKKADDVLKKLKSLTEKPVGV